MFKVKSKLAGKYSDGSDARTNGELGPFERRGEAERALIALCQAGQATSGEIVDTDPPVPDLTRTNEEGEAVEPIYDGDGLLTAITLNCDDLLCTQLEEDQRAHILGIRGMAEELIAQTQDELRCRYKDCPEGHPTVTTQEEQVTCETCREALGIPEHAYTADGGERDERLRTVD